MQKEGTVVQVFGLYYTVDDGTKRFDCFLKGKNRLNTSRDQYSNPVAVGDRVVFERNEGGSASILSVLPRNNVFSRKDSKKNTRADIIAANLDQVLIIQSFDRPPPNYRFVDRLAVRSYHENITPVLCVNKHDHAAEEDLSNLRSYYKNSGLKLVITSAKSGYGLDSLKGILQNKRTLLAGSSGVGKSSLINVLFDSVNLRTSKTSDKTGKGRHTTTNVVMFSSGKTELIDSPGVREFGMVELDIQELRDYFYEFHEYAEDCSFSDCTHEHEPKCAVKRAVEEGKIDENRYVSYCYILDSLYEAKENMYK